MKKVKLYIIKFIDWFDDNILYHYFVDQGLCTWICMHPWWGDNTIDYTTVLFKDEDLK